MKDAVISLAANQSFFESIAAHDGSKWMFGFAIETRHLSVGASEQGSSAAGTCTLKVDEGMGNLGYWVSHESFGAIEKILFAIVEQEQYGSFRPVVGLGEVGQQLQYCNNADAVISRPIAAAHRVIMGIDQDPAIVWSAFSGVKGLVILRSANSDNEVGAFKVDGSSTGGKGRVRSQVIDYLNLGGVQVLCGDDALDA